MLVTDRRETRGRDLVDVVAEAVAGGVELVQVREKDLSDDELLALVTRIRARVGDGVSILVNGRPAVAQAAGVGLHLPADAPMPVGPRPTLYGRSAHDEQEAGLGLREKASYILLGPVFPTGSKPGHPGSGLGLLSAVSRLVAPMPVLAIGGLTDDRVGLVRRAGAHGVAVRSAILAAPEPRLAAEAFARALAAAV
jgi:thiamine-phosphate pyrophosphorylase